MAKILLVEDDNNLREIYEARLQAEGYSIVSAHDGEEALVVAKAEKPDLIISDVMMPKISGFEMLDILRNTDTLKDVKIIMLTALGQNDDQQRADKLGADRYLVKSQVTLEDIVNVANELLGVASTPTPDATLPSAPPTNQATTDSAPPTTTTPEPPAAASVPEPVITTPPSEPVTSIPVSTPPAVEPPAPATVPVSTPVSTPDPSTDMAETEESEKNTVKSQIESFMGEQLGGQTDEPKVTSSSTPVEPAASDTPTANENDQEPAAPVPVAGMKVIQPLPSTTTKPDINELLAKETAKENMEKAVDQTLNQDGGSKEAGSANVISPEQHSPDGADPDSIAL